MHVSRAASRNAGQMYSLFPKLPIFSFRKFP